MKNTDDTQMNLFEEEKAENVSEIQENTVDVETEEEVKLIRGMWTEEEWLSPVIQNGPTRQEIEEWKDRYGSVYFTPFEGETFIWRTLSRKEYKEIIRDTQLTMLDREENITDKCVIFPRNFSCNKYTETGKAGVPSLLSEMIMDKSGFVAQSAPIKL